ncbi:hypothetical protein ACINB_31280 [Acidovorax sp. NB1]|nr:hypothetical protein ACINB_31280 [Acidovorax sp. NB1]
MSGNPIPTDIDAIEARVNEVINAAMSRAINERDALVRSYKDATSKADTMRSRLADASERMSRIESRIHGDDAESLQRIQTLSSQVEDVLRLVARIKDHRAIGCVELVGKEVTIVGGKQRMAAAGLNEDGLMVCFYEHEDAVGVQEIAIPLQALVLADTQVATKTVPAKARPARAVRGVGK